MIEIKIYPFYICSTRREKIVTYLVLTQAIHHPDNSKIIAFGNFYKKKSAGRLKLIIIKYKT